MKIYVTTVLARTVLSDYFRKMFLDFVPGGQAYNDIDGHIGYWFIWVCLITLVICSLFLMMASYLKSYLEKHFAEKKWAYLLPKLTKRLAQEVELLEIETLIEKSM